MDDGVELVGTHAGDVFFCLWMGHDFFGHMDGWLPFNF